MFIQIKTHIYKFRIYEYQADTSLSANLLYMSSKNKTNRQTSSRFEYELFTKRWGLFETVACKLLNATN